MQNVKVSIPDKIEIISTPDPDNQPANRNNGPASQNYTG
jgi:hypothetical protein